MNCAYSKNLLCCLPENERSNFGTTEKSVSMITKYGFYREATRLPLSPAILENLKTIPLPKLYDFDATRVPLSLSTTKAFGNKLSFHSDVFATLPRTLRTTNEPCLASMKPS